MFVESCHFTYPVLLHRVPSNFNIILISVHILFQQPLKPSVLSYSPYIKPPREGFRISLYAKQQYFLHQDLESVLILLGVRFINLCCWLSMF